MVKYICDRCGKEIDENYFTCALGCATDKTGRISALGAALNASENMRNQRMLCYECMAEIKDFIDRKKEREDGRSNQGNNTEIPKRNNNSFFRRK